MDGGYTSRKNTLGRQNTYASTDYLLALAHPLAK